MGKGDLNFISASNGAIEISSSNFHLKNGNITASNVDLSGKITATEGQFSGDVTATHISTDSGSIGGFVIGTTAISSSHLILSSSSTPTDEIISASNFNVKASGQLTASDAKIIGDITANTGTFSGTVNASAGNFTSTVTIGEGSTTGTVEVGTHTNKIKIIGTNSNSTTKIHSGTGTHANSNTGFYLGADGKFSLGDKLSWDGSSNLSVEGSIVITGGNAATTESLNQVTESVSQSIDTATGSLFTDITGRVSQSIDIATGSSLPLSVTASMLLEATKSLVDNSFTGSFKHTASQFSFGGDGLTLETNNASTGLNLTSQFIGFFDGANFNAFIDNSGNFYLGGASTGSLQWNNAAKSLNISGSAVRLITPEFVLGDRFTQFISGSSGTLVISSSNFHLSESGDVSMTGTISAEQGDIAGWQISGSKIKTGSGFFGVEIDHLEGLIGRGQEPHEFIGGGGAHFYFSPNGIAPPNLPNNTE